MHGKQCASIAVSNTYEYHLDKILMYKRYLFRGKVVLSSILAWLGYDNFIGIRSTKQEVV